MSEYITLLGPQIGLGGLIPNQNIVTETNCASLQMNFSPTGGSFSIGILMNSAALPPEDFVLTLPNARLGIVKNVGQSRSPSGLLDTISGPIVPLQMTKVNFASIVPVFSVGTPSFKLTSQLAIALAAGAPVKWNSLDVLLRSFVFRGISIQGIQQLAQVVLGDVYIYKNVIYILPPGVPADSTAYVVPNSDVVSFEQKIDYTLDVSSVLNPALFAGQFNLGIFVYDQEHARIQGQQGVTCGAIQGTGGTDFAPIPDGWMAEGTYDEWIPPSPTNTANPAGPSNGSSRYWKEYPSPTNPGFRRGILAWTRLVKDLKLNPPPTGPFQTLAQVQGNISPFVGTPNTAADVNYGSDQSFVLGNPGTENGIFGTNCEGDTVLDIISGQQVNVLNSLELLPSGVAGADSGQADTYSYSITLGLWTFPRVNPTTFPVGNPTNPFNLPSDVVVVNPSQNVVSLSGLPTNYWNDYLNQYRKINSPRLKTSVTCVYRNIIPEPGSSLILQAANRQMCGRIESVSLNFGRAGMTLTMQASVYGLPSTDLPGGFG